jgi:hypothetical protein
MPHYHLFFMGREDSRTIESAVFHAPDDVAAIALSAEGEFPLPLELWSGFDRIKRFERLPPAKPGSINRCS